MRFISLGILTLILSFCLFSQPQRAYKVLAVMVEFQTDDDPLTTGNGKFDLSFPSKKIIDPPPHDKRYFEAHLQFLKNYFAKFSIDVDYEIVDTVFTLSKQMRYYSPPQDSGFDRLLWLVYETWTIVKNSGVRTNLPLTSYDCYVIFHAGVGRDINLSAEYGYNPTPYDIPSVFINTDSIVSFLRKNGIGDDFGIKNSIILPETESRVVSTLTGENLLQLGLNGLLVSNFASFLGLPDLFDTVTGRSRIGRFGLMDGAGIFSYRGVLPPSPSAWEKVKLGICNPIEITLQKDTTLTIYAFQSDPSRSVFKIPINKKEYFLLENRNRDAFSDGARLKFLWRDSTGERIIERVFTSEQRGFNYFEVDSIYGVLIDVDEPDWALPGSGILIWYIDENVVEEKIKTNSINNDVKRLGVKLVEADGPQVIYGDEIGWEFDMWFLGNSAPLYKNEFSIRSYPWNPTNSRSNFNFKIYDFSAPSPVMTFKVGLNDTILNPMPSFPKQVEGLTLNSSITTANIDHDPKNEIILNSSIGIYAFNPSGTSLTLNPDGRYSRIGGDFPCAVFDVDGDGKKDVIGISGNKVVVFKTFDSNLDGFADSVWVFENGSKISTPPAIFRNEIIFGDSSGYLNFLRRDGTLEKKVKISDEPVISLIASDSMWIATSRTKVKTESREWKFNVNFVASTGIDLKGNGAIEIVIAIGEDGDIAIVNTQSGDFKMMKLPFKSKVSTAPALADLNADGYPDVIITVGDEIWALNYLGSVLMNFPIKVRDAVSVSAPVVVDFYGDGLPEIIVGTKTGLIYAFDVYGKIITGFPVSVSSSVVGSPAVFYESNLVHLFIASADGYLYGWAIRPSSIPAKVFWGGNLRDEKHSNYFSKSAFVEPLPRAEILDKNEVYNWPNPVLGDYAFIRVKTFYDSKVNIKIFDLAGFKVDEFDIMTSANFETDVKWDVSKVQGGVYYARIEANAQGRSDVKIIKIAIVK